MKGIKNIQYQNEVKQLFRLDVLEGKFKGFYYIKEPDGFSQTNVIIDVNDTYFNIDNFIFGESSKIRFIKYTDPETFELIKNVYEEQGGDGQIIFRWILSINGKETDILGKSFEINLNRYKQGFEKSSEFIECEIKKREVQNKLFTREDTTINLFATKNLDEKPITPVETQDIIYKEGNSTLRSAWHMKPIYNEGFDLFNAKSKSYQYADYHSNITIPNSAPFGFFFPAFNRSSDSEFGENTESFDNTPVKHIYSVPNTGDHWTDGESRISKAFLRSNIKGAMLVTKTKLNNLSVEISNLSVRASLRRYPRYRIIRGVSFPDGYEAKPLKFSLQVGVFRNNRDIHSFEIAKSKPLANDPTYHEIEIKNKEVFPISGVELNPNDELRLYFKLENSDVEINDEILVNTGAVFNIINTSTSIEVFTETQNLARKARAITLFNALDKIIENYSNGKLILKSDVLGKNGKWGNQFIATGLFLRGVAKNFIGEEKINTSFKSLFFDGLHPLLALGYDVQDNVLLVEDINYFFKDFKTYDLTNKPFIEDSLSIENDTDLSYNSLMFGTKKYSSKKNGDLKNFNTKMECTTPIKSIKKKFDKTTDLIIDEYKIQDILLDKSNRTGDNDDDLIIIDTIKKETFNDTGIFKKVKHENIGGLLVLIEENGWDTLPLKKGSHIIIKEGLNIGTFEIIDINLTRLTLNKRNKIQEGYSLTKIEYNLTNVIKNRNATREEGFKIANGVQNNEACTNLIHNPKYHLNRWFSYFSGGLSKKKNNENIVVASYKNNGKVLIEPDTQILKDYISGVVELKEPINIGRLKIDNNVFFNGEKIEITLTNIDFEEFYNIYSRWRYGVDAFSGKITPSRGYIDVKVGEQTISIYPIGSNAFEYERKYRELTIRGKIKNKQ